MLDVDEMLNRPRNNDPASWASRFRRKRFRIIESIIDRLSDLNGHVSILDVGGRRDYWNLLSPRLAQKTSLTILNSESELDIGRDCAEAGWLQVSYRLGDGCDMSDISDGSFDLAHSNSTIEHVGSLHRMTRFAKEIRRVGKSYYVQTPYLWFPLDPHYGVPFVHWLPGPTRASLLYRFNIGYARRQPNYCEALRAVDHTQIVDKTLMAELFPDGTMMLERFALMSKSIVMTRQPVFE